MVMCYVASFFEGKKLATPARIPLGIAGEDSIVYIRLLYLCSKYTNLFMFLRVCPNIYLTGNFDKYIL